MSSNSSKKSRGFRAWLGYVRNVLAVIGISSWALVSVFGFGGVIAASVLFGGLGQIGVTADETSVLLQMILSVTVYIVGAAILLIEPYAIRRMTMQQIRVLVGFARRPIIRDVGIGVVAWGGYMLLTTLASFAISAYIPGINLEQNQDLGFRSLNGQLELFSALFVIVIAAPIVEELVFRGYLYGSLRPRMPWWLAAVIVSILFGLVHGQLNVAIDTFILSMVACYIRDRTGAIWSGIVLHALKNSLAFWLLFLAPQWIRQLLMGA